MKLLVILQLTSVLLADQSVTINCNFSSSSGWHIFDEIYTCEVDSISSAIIEPNTLISAINGQHAVGKSNNDVRGFRVKNAVVNYFPKGLQKFFPNLIAISILSSNLKEVRQSDLSPFPQLKYLNFYNNNLKSVREDLFEFNKKLELIGLHYNEIKFVDVSIIQSLKNLRFLWLMELDEDRV